MRTYKSKNIQTKPSLSGENNMTDEVIKKDHQCDNGMDVLTEMFNQTIKKERYKKGTNWSADELRTTLGEYFNFCTDKSLKPSKSGVRVWLGCSKSQYHAWQSEPAKYGVISDLINLANDIMETQYVNRGEKYPTMNVFLLKTSHGHVEQSRLDITTNGQNVNNADDVKDLVAKLGLDKKK